MTINHEARSGTASSFGVPPTWVRVLLGIVMILAGVLVIGDVMLFTIISTIFIGLVAIGAGGFEIIHAFWTRGWGGFGWQIVLGLLYIAFGVTLLRSPVTGALALTFVLGVFLVASGIVRTFLGLVRRREVGWIMLLSGVIGILAGLVILTGWPATGLWVLGFMLGIDLIFHGVAWLMYGSQRSARTA